MRPLRYSINLTLDGSCDHTAIEPDEELHQRAAQMIERADALIFGRVTYQMMEEAWRGPVPAGSRPDWMMPFAQTIDATQKYVVSSTLDDVDWNAKLLPDDFGAAIQRLKDEPGDGLFTGGVQLPQALAELGLIDEYELVVHPRIAGHGRRFFEGLSQHVDLTLVDRYEYASGAIALTYEARR